MSAGIDKRIDKLNEAAANPRGAFVLYCMHAARRVRYNFALQEAVRYAKEFDRPLLIFEPLECGRPFDSDRMHAFVLAGMADNAQALAKKSASYFPFVERAPGESARLLEALAKEACLVIVDDFPLRESCQAAKRLAQKSPVQVQTVDSNGLLPVRGAGRAYPTAYSFRRFLQQELPRHLEEFPQADPLRNAKLRPLRARPRGIAGRPPAGKELLAASLAALRALPLDHSVAPAEIGGGAQAAQRALRRFIKQRLGRYLEDRNKPEEEATSGLSPYLHFGHISAHQVFVELMRTQDWSAAKVSAKATGKRSGWWRAGAAVEAFLDQLITWREVGYNFCAQRSDYDQYASLPEWAQKTLAKHARDLRPYIYSPEELEQARTHDPLWNAAQIQLAREGRLHNYLRMLWGKKILEWTPSPQEALEIMMHLNNKYALDGRNPNSYAGICWCLGRYDRPWGPERPIFGTVRYMSSENTARKVRTKGFIEKYRP